MEDADVAAALRALANRARYLPAPSACKPECFHEQRDELAHDIQQLAERIKPSTVEERRHQRRAQSGRTVTTQQGTFVVNGRRVTVLHRRAAFAIHHGD
jgi:hypothetical protein